MRRRLPACLALSAGLLALLGAASAAEAQIPGPPLVPITPAPERPPEGSPPRPPPADPPPPRRPRRAVRRRLSNEGTLSYWAVANERAVARRRPDARSRGVGRLRYETEHGSSEVYLALERYTDTRGRNWVRVRLLGRPNGRTGWVRRYSLGRLHRVTTQLRIDRTHHRAALYRGGRRIWRAPVGHGAPGAETPTGRFYIREKLRSSNPKGLYGPLAFGTSAYSRLSDWPNGGVVGIHGTNQPWLIPGRPSHGCVRVRNPDIMRLARLMPVGTPVHIFNQPR